MKRLLILLLFIFYASPLYAGMVVQETASGGASCTTANDTLLESYDTSTSTDNLGTYCLAQGFENSNAFTVTEVKVSVCDNGATGNLVMSIFDDSGGDPNAEISGTSVELTPSEVTDCGTASLHTFTLSSPVANFDATTTYHIQIDMDGGTGTYVVPYDSAGGYTGGTDNFQTSCTGGWTSWGQDFKFEVWGCE